MHQIKVIATALAFLLPGVFGSESARASIILHISVDTSSLSGQSGFLDFQLNPGDSTTEAATATITNFQTAGGLLAPLADLTGDVTGLLPGMLTLGNSTAFNDIFQGFTFGNGISLDLTLSGPAVDTPGGSVGSSFALSLYDAAGTTPLLTIDPNGSVTTINLNANGSISAQTFSQSSTNNTPAAIVTNAVPEPSTLISLAIGLPLLLIIHRYIIK